MWYFLGSDFAFDCRPVFSCMAINFFQHISTPDNQGNRDNYEISHISPQKLML